MSIEKSDNSNLQPQFPQINHQLVHSYTLQSLRNKLKPWFQWICMVWTWEVLGRQSDRIGGTATQGQHSFTED